MDIRKLQRAIVDGLEDVKAQDIVVFNTEHLSPLFERVVVASGSSNRQTKALAASVRDAVRKAGFQIMRTEGESNGEWIIIDCAAAVVHVMQPAIRQYYQLEEIWGDKPVAIKLAAGKAGLVKASEPDEAPVKPKKVASRTPAQKAATQAPTKQVVAKKAAKSATKPATKPAAKVTGKKAPAPAPKTSPRAAPKVAVKTTAKTAAKTAAKKAPARKAVAPKLTKVVVNAPERKKAPARKAAVKTAPKASPKTVAVKRVTAKKVAAKKAPARKSSR
jgi:ribosome-associated protein